MGTFTNEDIDSFLESHTAFQKVEEDGIISLIGKVKIIAGNKDYLFEVKIISSDKYPYSFPRVFEISNKIKKIADWHINIDGSFCFTVEPVEVIACKNGMTLTKFYLNWLIPYLANQQYRINEGKYANGEYGHFIFGIFEYYAELLKTENIYTIGKLMAQAYHTKKIERTSKCICGSGKKYRKCHRDSVNKLWAGGDDLLVKHYSLFQKYISIL